jgi:hypothetical protein
MRWWRYAASTMTTVGFSATGVAKQPVRMLRKFKRVSFALAQVRFVKVQPAALAFSSSTRRGGGNPHAPGRRPAALCEPP